MNQNKTSTSTDNLTLAAFLLSEGCKFLGIERISPAKVHFIFSDTPELKKLTEEFWRSEGKVEPKKLAHSLRDLKSMIYQSKGGER
jgi:hypothetical protein